MKLRCSRPEYVVFLGTILAGCSVATPRDVYMDFIRPDLRPPLVGAPLNSDSVWGRADESARGDGISERRRADLEALVKRYAPTLVLPKNEHVTVNDHKYYLFPTNAHLFADTLRIDLMRAAPYAYEDSIDIAFRTLDGDSLRALSEGIMGYQTDPNVLAVRYFDFPGDKPKEWWEAYGRLRTGPDSSQWARPTVYAHPFQNFDGRVVIQYWMFYPFNDFIGNHEGDWERINVVLSPDRSSIAEVHYYFHARAINLPQGEYEPEIVDDTHPVVYVGGRMYNILDYPIRIFAGEKNEGSHGSFPYAGEWEAAGGMGAPESVKGPGKDSSRVVPHGAFDVVLTPEPSRLDYQRHPDVLKEWAWLLMPVRFGFPSVTSLGSELGIDVGNRAWFGPGYHPGWNRTAPGLLFNAYSVKKIPFARSAIEDILQPWYWLYIFRHPRYVHDVRGGAMSRDQLERLGLVPRGGWRERGVGTTLFGVHLAYPTEDFSNDFDNSTSISLWRGFWMKMRFGAIELLGGYQKFSRREGGSMFVYPLTANLVVRTRDALFRTYATGGGGLYGWQSRVGQPTGGELVNSGWDLGWNAGAGVEYYLRANVAFDVGFRYHRTAGPGPSAGFPSDRLQFFTIWIGHYLRL